MIKNIIDNCRKCKTVKELRDRLIKISNKKNSIVIKDSEYYYKLIINGIYIIDIIDHVCFDITHIRKNLLIKVEIDSETIKVYRQDGMICLIALEVEENNKYRIISENICKEIFDI